MATGCGGKVSWSGTKGGKLSESTIPDPPEHRSHYINAAETKGDSSFPVVDGSGNLRAGNVNSAWDLRGRGEGVSEGCLKSLDNAFEDRVLPDSAYENTVTLADETSLDGEFGLNVEFSTHPSLKLERDGFNEHGVRVNDDGSVDVRFIVMEPGVRRGVEITPEFLDRVAGNAEERLPVQLDHDKSQLSNVGRIDPENVQFKDGFLQMQPHFPNTGSSIREDVLADFKHNPPEIQDVSVGFDPRTVEIDTDFDGEDGNPTFVDAELRELSLTPFPAGYDNGGLTPAFSDALDAVMAEDCGCADEEKSSPTEATSALQKSNHTIIRK